MIHVNRLLSLFLLLLATGAGVPAGAAVLYLQAPVNGGAGIEAEYSTTDVVGFQNAESYALGGAATVTGFRWWGSFVDDSDLGLFVVRRFDAPAPADVSGSELSGAISRSAAGVQDASGLDIFQYDLTLAGPLALSGTGYLSVFVDTLNFWYWLEGAPGDGVSLFRGVEGDFWQSGSPDLSLAVIGFRFLPEPGTLVLLAAALVAIVMPRRRA